MADCAAAEKLADSHAMRALLLAKIVSCIIGPILLYWNIRTVGTNWLVHPNAKFIYRAHLIYTLLVSIGFLAVYSLDFWRLSIPREDPCLYRVSVKLAVPLRTINVIGIYGQILTMSALAVERFIAMLQPRHYEKVESDNLAKVLVVMGTVFSVSFCTSLLIPGVDWEQYNVGFVIRTPENQDRYQLVVWFELVPQILTLLILHLVRVLSNPPRIACWRRRVDLASRYQTEESLKICHHLLPVFYTHFVIFTLTAFGITLFPFIFPEGDEADFALFLEFMAWTPLYACAMPIIVKLLKIEDGSTHRGRRLVDRATSSRSRSSPSCTAFVVFDFDLSKCAPAGWTENEASRDSSDVFLIIMMCIIICFAIRHANDFYTGEAVTLVEEGVWGGRFRHREEYRYLKHVDKDFDAMFKKLKEGEEERIRREQMREEEEAAAENSDEESL